MADKRCRSTDELVVAVNALAADVESKLWRPFSFRVTDACRGRGVQAAIYRRLAPRGAMAAPPGRSAHEFGMAVDVRPNTPLGYNDKRAYRVLHELAPKHGLTGIDIDRDAGHFQLTNWRWLVSQGAPIYPGSRNPSRRRRRR